MLSVTDTKDTDTLIIKTVKEHLDIMLQPRIMLHLVTGLPPK